MAAVLEKDAGTAAESASISFPILKTETTADGDIIVYGKATDGSVDSDQQIVDPAWSAKALSEWLESGGNLRVQHNPHRDPAGVGLAVDIDKDGDGSHWLKALVVEPAAKKLVSAKALRAFSVGIMRPRIVTDKSARGGRIVDGELGEISLVDRPANRNCAFTLVKADKSGRPVYVGDTGEVAGSPVPSPAVVARMLGKGITGAPARPEVEQGRVPTAAFADPVARRLRDAMDAEKRDTASGRIVDSGGRDVTDLGDEDFAGPGHTFPIKTQDDVSDAASLAHHAKDPDAVRSRIRSIANRKFPGMDMPPSLAGKGAGGDCPTCHGDGMIMENHRKCPDCGGSGDKADWAGKGRGNIANFGARRAKPFGKKTPPGDDGDGDDEDSAEKGGGLANFDGHRAKPFTSRDDAKSRDGSEDEETDAGEDDGAEKNAGGANRPGDTGHKYPNPNEDGDEGNNTGDDDDDDDRSLSGAGGEAGMKGACGSCGTGVKRAHAFCPGCGSKLAWPALAKGKPTKIVIEGPGDKDGDGDGLFDADGDGDGAVARLPKPGEKGAVPTHGVRAKDSVPVPAHREPDGPQMEIFEEDAGMEEGDEKREGDSEPAPTWGGQKMARETDAPYTIMRAHDALCAAYHADDVLAAYPSLKTVTDALDPEAMRQAALGLVNSEDPSDWQAGTAGLVVASKAAEIMGAEEAVVADARAALSKAFADMYPSVHLSPGECSPSKFRRPYISEGHQHESAASHGPDPSVSLPPAARPASSFTRGPITDGHERPSPGNGAQGMKAAPSPQFKGRHFYSNAARDNTHRAMQQVHDHIASLFPDVCPMGGTGGPAAAPAEAKPEMTKRRGTAPVIIKAKKRKGDIPNADVIAKAAAARAAEAVEKRYRAQLDGYEAELGALRAQVDYLGGQPDPREAPIRSAAVLNIPTNKAGGAGPVERRSLVEDAAETMRAEKLRFLQSLASSGDPAMRENAQGLIRKMLA